MRKLLLLAPLLAVVAYGCKSKTPVGPGTITITETTTSTTTTTTTTSTIAAQTVAKLSFSPVTPEVLQTVNFDGGDSTPGTNRRIVSYSWDFGDGVKKTGVTATHDFFPSGTYLVTLTVVDSAGDSKKDVQPITVRPVVP